MKRVEGSITRRGWNRITGLSLRAASRIARSDTPAAQQVELEPPDHLGLDAPARLVLEGERIHRALHDAGAAAHAAVVVGQGDPAIAPGERLGVGLAVLAAPVGAMLQFQAG